MRQTVGGVVYGDDARVGAWVQDQLGGGEIAGPFQALGVENADGQLIFGALFFNQREGDLEIAIASTEFRPALPTIFRRIFDYPFRQLGLPRLTAEIPASNQRCVVFAEYCGFKLEGVKRNADGRGGPVLVYGLLKDECLFMRDRHGQGTEAAAAD